MATTGNIVVSKMSWQLKLEYSITQDIANNKSTIVYTLSVYNNNSARNEITNEAYYTINGTKTYKTFNYSSTKAWHQLGTKTETITHNADGTKTVAMSAKWYSGISGSSYTPEYIDLSGTVNMPTIPRGSTFNSFTTTADIGTVMAISFTPASNTFTHKIKYKMSGQSSETQIASLSAGTTSYNWTIPTSFYSLCPNAKRLNGTLYLYTYSGNTQVGTTNTKAIACDVSISNAPTVVFTISEGNSTVAALTGSSGTTVNSVIKGYSNITATITATAQNSATIASRKITYNNTTSNYSSPITYNAVASNTWKSYVSDSRGLANQQTKTATLINYSKPTTAINAALTLNPNDTTKAIATLTIKITMFSGSFGSVSNSATGSYRYRVQGGSWGSWTNYSTTLGSAASATNTITVNNLNATDTYEFQSRIVDRLETVSSNTTTVSAMPIFDMSKTDFHFNVPVQVIKQGSSVLNEVRVKNSDQDFALHLAASGNKGLWDYTNNNWIISRVASNNRVLIQDELGVNTIYTQGVNPFAANDTITFNNAYVDYPAHTSNAGKDLIFTITYPHQSMKDVSTLTVIACKLAVRTPQGYIKIGGASSATTASGYDFKADSNATITATKIDRYTFVVKITMTQKFENIPDNNVCVAVNCLGLNIKFS